MRFPYRADHVGSLLRPAALLAARNDPTLSREQLKTIEDMHILEALKRQKEAGLKIFTDGELRRTGFMGDFYESVENLERLRRIRQHVPYDRRNSDLSFA